MRIIKIYGTWFLVDNDELLDSFDTRLEAENALWDKNRRWVSLWDIEQERKG